MKYSIFGCGWLGFPFAQHLVQQNHLVKGSTTSIKKLAIFSEASIEPYHLYIDNNQIVGDTFRFLESDVLIISIPFSKQKENLTAYKKLASYIEKSSIQKVIFISSTSVYADTNDLVTEDASMDVNPPKQKLVDLENIFINHPGFDTTIIRFSGLIGGSRNPGNFFKNKSTVENGLAPINLIHLDDCIQILQKLCDKNFPNQIFNASSDTHPTRKEFYTTAIRNLGKTPPKFSENKDFSYKIISNEKLKTKLEYSFKHSDLMKMLEVFKN
ncbi:SDR family oxidoreductase [Flavicella marina]|uniref:SDR family oxidoreductase n=1 Tax=Flavicella marina TaxID=1475951 RepID=UPI001264A376|nr:SDR family oxidoreductase [Flavicella marina]